MAGVVLETLSNKKLLILSLSLVLILAGFFLIGGLIAPAPNSVISSIAVKCVDFDNLWHTRQVKPFTPRGKDKCYSMDTFSGEADKMEIEQKHIDANQIVFSQLVPLPRDGIQLDMSRWFQNLISVLDINIEYNSENPYPEHQKPELLVEAKLFYRDKEDDESDWKLLAESTERRTLNCVIEKDIRVDGSLYHCELLPFFELGSVHYDYYLINIRLPVNKKDKTNQFGQLADLSVIVK